MPLDLTAMYATHQALRRELECLARSTVRAGENPRRIIRAAIGWRLVKQTVRGHHRAEGDVLWPALRRHLADRPADLVVLEAMEAEHAAIDQLIVTIDELAIRPEACSVHFGDLIDSLVTGLEGHLAHEEEMVLPLVQQVLTAAEWAAFEQANHEWASAAPSRQDHWTPAR